jgi:hypothetical protein
MLPNPDAEQFVKTIQIGEMRFGETTTPSFPGIPTPNSPQPLYAFTLKPTVVSLDEARTLLPFGFTLPAWMPPGFVLEPEVSITLPPQELGDNTGTTELQINIALASLHLRWRHADGPFIGLSIRPVQANQQHSKGIIAIPPGGVVAVQVHQQPAALIMQQHGFSPADHSVHISDVAVLRWCEYNKQYGLRARKEHVSVDDMLRIANSITE